MVKNELVTVEIEDYTRDGEGIGHADGCALFVKDAVIGDVVRARITRPKKNYAYARLEELLVPSPDRTEPRCAEARRCGGCRMQELTYGKQLVFKRKLVMDALRRIGGFAPYEAPFAAEAERAEVPPAESGVRPEQAETLAAETEWAEVPPAESGVRPEQAEPLAAEAERAEVPPAEGAEKVVPVMPVIGMDCPFRYRNKAQYPISAKSGRPEAGFYAGRTHSLIPVRDCVLTREVNARILAAFLEYMERCHVSAYDEVSGKGLVRHLLIREGFATGEILVCPVINGRTLPAPDVLVSLLTAVPGVRSICLNSNEKRGNTILGDRTIALFGEPWISDILGGLNFRISPRSFYQVNPVQTERLYAEALRAAALTGDETVYDLYCGIGTISLYLARRAREVYGVEIIPEAIRDAKANALRNGIGNAHFFVGAAEELVRSGEFAPGVPCPRPDVVVLDPPRKGCAASLIEAVLRLSPQRIVYVSCDPATLARDLKLFTEGTAGGTYVLQYVQPVDMFPHTGHVETVCLLGKQKREPDSYIDISLDMEDYYRIRDGKHDIKN